MRHRFIQDRLTGDLIPAAEYKRAPPAGPLIMPDIEHYKEIINGTMITSRSKHREFLARHDKQEVGNEMPAWMREKEYEGKHGG